MSECVCVCVFRALIAVWVVLNGVNVKLNCVQTVLMREITDQKNNNIIIIIIIMINTANSYEALVFVLKRKAYI